MPEPAEQPKPKKPRRVRKKTTAPSKAFSSRVSSGTALFPKGVDGRSEFARLVRDRFLQLIADQGGLDNVSTLGQTMVRRIAVIDAICVDREAKLALGQEVDVAEYMSLCNVFNRLGNTIGLARKQIDVTPSLSDYLRSKAAGSSQPKASTRQPEKPSVSLLQAMTDPALFGGWFSDPSWSAWKTFIKAFSGEAMTAAELPLYTGCTGRESPPRRGDQARQAWVCCGRRAGKSRLLSMIAIYAALILDWSAFTVPGETAVVMIFAADRQQARVIFGYILAMLRESTLFRDEVKRETADEILLRNGISIQIATSNFRSLRGRTILCALLDEVAFWYTGEQSATPDTEVVRAVLAAQASLRGHGIFLAASSPYAKQGALFDACKRYYGKPGRTLVWMNAPSKLMNPTISDEFLAEEAERDPEGFVSEFEGRFRDDIAAFVTREIVDSVTVFGRYELPYDSRNRYLAFVDPSGGSSDSMVLCIAYREKETGRAIMAVLREHKAPFDPGVVVASMAGLLKAYRISEVVGDRYAGEWPAARFKEHGIRYVPSDHSKTEIYANCLPLFNCGKVELLDSPRLSAQLIGLERRTTRGSGREIIDHKLYGGAKDDAANAACGGLLLASDAKRGGMKITPEMLQKAAMPGWRPGDPIPSGRGGTPWPVDPNATFPSRIVT